MDDNPADVINELLQGYEKELSRLQQQQRLLEDAPTTFGELASRVHAEVERRIAADRRAEPRATPDRRVNTVTPSELSPKP
jgi:hypothetical protein